MGEILSGVLNVWKPMGCTSRDVVNHVQRLLPRRTKIGHAGTLDPLAEGVLVICVGTATRLIDYAQRGRKRYEAKFRLGLTTNTDDIEGSVLSSNPSLANPLTRDDVDRLLPHYVGTIQQVPPQFSAVHVKGQRAYDLARKGEAVKLAARSVEVYQLTITEFASPDFCLEIECGSGVYVRSLGRDLGTELGCGATMTALRRTQVGSCDLKNAIPLADLAPVTWERHLLPPESLLTDLPQQSLTPQQLQAVRQGQSIDLTLPPTTPEAALFDANQRLAAIAIPLAQGQKWRPKIMLAGAIN